MRHYKEHLILSGSTIKQALLKLNDLSQDAILFVVDLESKLLGSLTDGDVRRGLLNDFSLEDTIDLIIQKHSRYIKKGDNDIQKIIEYRDANYRVIIDRSINTLINKYNHRIKNLYTLSGSTEERIKLFKQAVSL